MADRDVRIAHLVLAEHRLDFVVVDVRERDGVRDGDTALVLPAYSDVWWLLVEPDSEALEFRLDNLLVTKRLENVEDNEDEVASSRDWLKGSAFRSRTPRGRKVCVHTSDDWRV